MVALKLGEEGFTKSHTESIYYLIYGFGNVINCILYDENFSTNFVKLHCPIWHQR